MTEQKFIVRYEMLSHSMMCQLALRQTSTHLINQPTALIDI